MLTRSELKTYDYILLMFSGGKDSIACALELREMGVPAEKIELWHHLVDGVGRHFMDYPVTESYCRAFAKWYGSPMYISFREGGFEREMNRLGQPTAAVCFEVPPLEGNLVASSFGRARFGGDGPKGTRRKFPQTSSNLSVRWCSAYLKIDVARVAINNQDRFKGKRTLVITGERAQESTARANYKPLEVHSCDLRNGKRYTRYVDQWRPVHHWGEDDVWNIIERYRINPHPAYKAGWSRLSCMTCIFGNADQWKSAFEVSPTQVGRIMEYEREFGCTIKQGTTVIDQVKRGEAYAAIEEYKEQLRSTQYVDRIELDEGEWTLPLGAFGKSNGPT